MTHISDIRSVLLVGRTGNGKSALANVITGTNDFEEGEYATSETKEYKDVQIDLKGIKYRIVDTMGIDGTRSSRDKALEKLAEACWNIQDEINLILFVTSGSFTEEEILVYKMLRDTIFGENVTKHMVVVRTYFPNFQNDDKCQEDIQKMKEYKGLDELFLTCKKIIHIDNPPINVVDKDELNFNLKKREASKTILLEYLERCDEIYKPKNFYKKEYSRLENSIERKGRTIERLEKIKNGLSGWIKKTIWANYIADTTSIITSIFDLIVPITDSNHPYIRIAMLSSSALVSIVSFVIQQHCENIYGKNFGEKLENKQNKENNSLACSILRKSTEKVPILIICVDSLMKLAAHKNWNISHLFGGARPASKSRSKLELLSTVVETSSVLVNIYDTYSFKSSKLKYVRNAEFINRRSCNTAYLCICLSQNRTNIPAVTNVHSF